jgi:hypothetical protein
MAHVCRGFLPGNQEAIGVDLAQIALNPDDSFADDFEFDQFVEVINDRLFATVAFLGQVSQAHPHDAINRRSMREFDQRMEHGFFEVMPGANSGNNRQSHGSPRFHRQGDHGRGGLAMRINFWYVHRYTPFLLTHSVQLCEEWKLLPPWILDASHGHGGGHSPALVIHPYKKIGRTAQGLRQASEDV